ncbi:DUF2911 domain-containing protein, partial [Fulvivirga sp. RKSG066]|uniref:DUF2911 domain-containing protein n=1 Tax=Fulvivirga aurantia TaxID=2529383 RepID=UPI0012BBAB21
LMTAAVACDSPKKESEAEAEDTTMVAEDTESEAKEEKDDAPIASPRMKAEGTVGTATVKIDYGSPAVKDRKIWGGLEEYGVVWRAGANETTAIAFSEDVTIDGNKVPAGKYGIYMIPRENEPWTLIINKDWDREEHGAWGAYNYNEENDIARVEVSPEWVDENQERLTYSVEDGSIKFAWEKARISVPVEGAGSAG